MQAPVISINGQPNAGRNGFRSCHFRPSSDSDDGDACTDKESSIIGDWTKGGRKPGKAAPKKDSEAPDGLDDRTAPVNKSFGMLKSPKLNLAVNLRKSRDLRAMAAEMAGEDEGGATRKEGLRSIRSVRSKVGTDGAAETAIMHSDPGAGLSALDRRPKRCEL